MTKRSQTISAGAGAPQSSLSSNTGASATDAHRLRPAFSAFQQHYSPAKSLAPKPLTATFLAPPSPSKLPANVAASAETGRLQTELLQLHLLHRDAADVDAAWRASAKKQLGARFTSLVARAEDVRSRESRAVERTNAGALRAWGQDNGKGQQARGLGRLEDKVRMLDEVLGALWALGEQPGGRYARVVRRFERWAEKVAEITRARQGGNGVLQGENSIVFVTELDANWRTECEGLARRLDECRRMLRDMGDAPDEDAGGQDTGERSSLAEILAACRAMVRDMLAELDLMEQVARDAVAQENEWVRRINAGEGGGGDREIDAPRAGAIWRAF
jgi:hypothetical protein